MKPKIAIIFAVAIWVFVGTIILWGRQSVRDRNRGYARGVYQTKLYYSCKGAWPPDDWQHKARDYVNTDWNCQMVDMIGRFK